MSCGGSPNCYGASATRRRNSGQKKTHHRPRRWPLARGPIFEPWSPREEWVGACGRRHYPRRTGSEGRYLQPSRCALT